VRQSAPQTTNVLLTALTRSVVDRNHDLLRSVLRVQPIGYGGASIFPTRRDEQRSIGFSVDRGDFR